MTEERDITTFPSYAVIADPDGMNRVFYRTTDREWAFKSATELRKSMGAPMTLAIVAYMDGRHSPKVIWRSE